MTRKRQVVGRDFFARPTAIVAADLLSCLLWRVRPDGLVSGRIVETEAYLDASDRASHAAWSKRGQDVMHREPGTIYIYRSYGIHWMLNFVAHEAGSVGAVLVRAIEPLVGIELMQSRRNIALERLLCSGPGKLCQAFAIDDRLHKLDIGNNEQIWITHSSQNDPILCSARIGISKSVDLPLRFFVEGNHHVSAHQRGVPYASLVLPST